MEQSLNKDNNSVMDEVLHEDWPLLQELENTRYSLKNKKAHKKENTVSSIREMSQREDDLIAAQNIQDEKLVEAFLDEKPTNDIPNQSINKINDRIANQPQRQNQSVMSNQEQLQRLRQVQQQPRIEENEEISKLAAKGLGKVYVEKTNVILSPLRFLVVNLEKIIIGLIQFVFPAIITWILLNYSDLFKNILIKETEYTQYLYIGIFYFACLFISITSQVLLSGIANVIKMIVRNLAVEAKK